MDDAALNRAEPARGRKRAAASPYRAIVIFQESENDLAGELLIFGELAALPTREAFQGADRKRAVAGGEQTVNTVGRERLIGWRLPWNVSDTVEPEQAELSAQPEIAVGGLGNCCDAPFGKALADLPSGVRVLADIESGIQREDTGAHRQHHATQHSPQPKVSSASPADSHGVHIVSDFRVQWSFCTKNVAR